MGTTLAEKVWADHLVRKGSDGAPDLLYIDLMLMHEVTSPQAFEGLRLAGRKPRHVDQLIATEDHNTPTVDIDRPNPDETSALQLSTLEKNCKDFGVRLCPLGDADQGVVHAFAPVLGLTQPGMTIVCGDSHTSTHGAFGAMAIGISFAFAGLTKIEDLGMPLTSIGLASFILSLAGSLIGVFFGKRFHLRVEIFGGLVLIGIGVKILVEHLFLQ